MFEVMNKLDNEHVYPVLSANHVVQPYLGMITYSINDGKFYIYTSNCKWEPCEECDDYIKLISGCDKYVFLKSELNKIINYDKVYVIQDAKVYVKINNVWIKK